MKDLDYENLDNLSSTQVVQLYEELDGAFQPGSKYSREILRLARLGLWAKKHGIKVAEAVQDNDSLIEDGYTALLYLADSALAALPTND